MKSMDIGHLPYLFNLIIDFQVLSENSGLRNDLLLCIIAVHCDSRKMRGFQQWYFLLLKMFPIETAKFKNHESDAKKL